MPLVDLSVKIPRFDEYTFDLQIGSETLTLDRNQFQQILQGRVWDPVGVLLYNVAARVVGLGMQNATWPQIVSAIESVSFKRIAE